MTTYYVDSVGGSDANLGQSAEQAYKTIAALSQISLKPGDTVLLARDSVFAETLTLTKSGKEGAPITIGAYGTGEAPTFSGNIGILGTKTAYIVVKDIAFNETTGAAIYGNNVKNWTIDNVSFTDTGTLTGIGGVFFKTGSNVSLTNSSFDGVAGDGLFVMNIDGLNVSNNSFTGLHGAAADGIQFTDSKNVTVVGNHIDQSTSPDTTKGGIVGNNVQNVVMSDNDILGGSFGMSINGQHITLDGNNFTGQDKYTWSASILIGGNWDLVDYTITNNTFTDSRFGISLTGLRDDDVVRTDINITNNVFDNMERSALKIDKPSTGTFADNILIESEAVIVKGEGFDAPYAVGTNLALTAEQAIEYFAPKVVEPVVEAPIKVIAPVKHADNIAPIAVNDMVRLDLKNDSISGNLLTNDIDANGDTLMLRTVGSQKFSNGHLDLAGLYGTLTVQENGDYTYHLYDDAFGIKTSATKITEKFQYKMSDGVAVDTAALVIDVTDFMKAHVAADLLV